MASAVAGERPRAPVVVVAAAAVLGAGVLARWLRQRLIWHGHGEAPPMAPGWLPGVGHLFDIIRSGRDNNKVALGRWALDVLRRGGGPVFSMHVLGRKMHVVTDPDLIEEVVHGDPHRFTKDFASLGGSMDLAMEIFGESGLFFVNTDDPRWSVTHNILKAPFSIRGMRTLFPLMAEQADQLVDALKREVGYGGVCHVDHWVTKMAFETIAVCGLGTSFNSFDDGADHPFIVAMNSLIAGMTPFAFVPKWLWPILLRGRLAEIRGHGRLVRETCVDVIRKRREHITKSEGLKRDLMDMMLNDTDPKSGEAMTEEMLVDNVLTFLFAGQDSTAAAMATCMCYLSSKPECKTKLVQEIDDIVGKGELTMEHLSKMKYLDWCVKESMRLVPPASGVMRAANGHQLLGGKWRFEAGEQVIIPMMALHYDERLWGADAREFRPERWENGPPHKYAYMPFALGPRQCIGREFTVVEQKITFVKLLQNFDFRRPAEVKPEPGYTTVKREDIKQEPFIDMDVEFKQVTAFVGLFSAFELLERRQV